LSAQHKRAHLKNATASSKKGGMICGSQHFIELSLFSTKTADKHEIAQWLLEKL